MRDENVMDGLLVRATHTRHNLCRDRGGGNAS